MNNYEENVVPVSHTKNYDWNKPLQAGSIVLAGYNDFKGNRKAGIFLVLYDEQLDNDLFESKNVLAMKLSTQTTLLSNYVVRIPMNRNQFLNTPSLICCSKTHLLHKCDNIYNVLGQLDSGTVKLVYKTYKKFINEVDRQILDSI